MKPANRLSPAYLVLTLAWCLLPVSSSFAANLTGRWSLDAPSSPYADVSGHGNPLTQDPNTSAAVTAGGVDGNAARLSFQSSSGIATRLCAYGTPLQSDSFGFALWVNPVSLSSGDNLIGKEMAATTSGGGFSRLAWQVHLGADNGSGAAPIEFLVRGNDRSKGDFFGNVISTLTLPLHTAVTHWFHVAGGYSAATGKLVLFVDGTETDSSNGVAGAVSSDGSALVLGSMVNGSSYVNYAASANIDDLQFYDGPLSRQDVFFLLTNLGLAAGGSYAPAPPAGTGTLIAHWLLDEASAPYLDFSGNGNTLARDAGTAATQQAPGVDGMAAQLTWEAAPGAASRLCAYTPSVQTDSFGFSFWVQPVSVAAGDNLIGKEMPATSSGDAFSRLAWQVHLGADNGSGAAPVEFLVRGNDRSKGNFFGSVLSGVLLPLRTASGSWYHIAGGYDASTGKLTLFVNRAETDSTNGQPGAASSDGSAFTVGTMVNGSSFVAYAALANIDDVQLYNAPLTATDVAALYTAPGQVKPVQTTIFDSFPRTVAAHWKLDEGGTPYAEATGKPMPLMLDSGTSPAQAALGVDGGAAVLNSQGASGNTTARASKTSKAQNAALNVRGTAGTAGVATRLCAYNDALQTSSFSFSFWVRPANMSPAENLIGKEMAATTSGDAYSRVAWQVQVGQDDGSGYAPLEFLVRGANRSQGNFYGDALSSVTLPLHAATNEWYHVAGGYDVSTGTLALFVNGARTDSVNSQPGAWSADGGAFVVGTMINGNSYVAYGAQAAIDDVQLYSGLVSSQDVIFLLSTPGWVTTQKPFAVTNCSAAANGGMALSFNSYVNYDYTVDAARNLAGAPYVPIATVKGTGDTTTVTLTKAALDAVLHDTTRPQLFLRVHTLLPAAYDPIVGSVDYSVSGDPYDSPSQGYPPAVMTPFVNTEPYVSQFHYSLASPGALAGDPCGFFRYQNTYHLFTWDHSISTDLVTWTPQGYPMVGLPGGISAWTGTIALDLRNTSGYGSAANPPWVAVYTAHDASGIEDVRTSSTTDYRNLYYTSANPVIPNNDKLFRDPDVFWDTQTNRWIAVVAHSGIHHLEFWASNDLKSWQMASYFGPLGATEQIWEVPGLVQLPIRGTQGRTKWVLYTGMGPNKVEYFVGNFDGTNFTPDADNQSYLTDGAGLDGVVFADFEGNSWADNGWTATGDAFGSVTGWGKTADQPATGYLGQRLASSYVGGDYRSGTLASRSFTITYNCINFLIGGGNHPGQTCINLLVNGQVVRTATGENSDVLKWQGWNVSQWLGQTAQLQIVDTYGGLWGRIYVDQIMFSNILTNSDREHANWLDFGSDFYAARVLRDYDGADRDVHWMGWMGNWQYNSEEPSPSKWGKGTESLPRIVELEETTRGYQIVQRPILALQKLRGNPVSVGARSITGTVDLAEFQPTANTYEIDAVFNLAAANQNCGLNLCVGGGQKVVVGYDASSSNVYLDRTSSGYVSFDPAFPCVVTAPLVNRTGYVKLHVFVDQTSIEVFVNDGRQMLSSTIYPDTNLRGVQLFSNNGPTVLRNLSAWQLATIWK